MIRPLAFAAAVALLACVPAHAQEDPAGDPASGAFLSRFNFHLNAATFATADDAFSFDADFGGDLDFVDYGAGRVNLLANYEVILGNVLGAFDPNQGNYTLDVSGSLRLRGNELQIVYHHVSRHFGDRSKTFPIDWNMLGVRWVYTKKLEASVLQFASRAFKTTQRSYVDYSGEVGAGASVRHGWSPRLSWLTGGEVVVFGTDAAVAGREAQVGAYAEGGVRIDGAHAALELFVAAERRVDAVPLTREARSWILAGFRLVNR